MNLVIYAICSGLNRGAVLLYFPFLIAFLSIEDFGIWSVSFVTANLFSPVLSMGGANSILREGSEVGAGKLASKLTFNFIKISIFFSAVLFFIFFVFGNWNWLLLAILMGFGFSIFDLLSSFSRAIDEPLYFLGVSLLRVFALFIAIIFALLNEKELLELLLYQAVLLLGFGLISVFSLYYLNVLKYDVDSDFSMKSHLKFSVSLIPHSVFQWISSSSDRLVINYIMGPYATGVYSLLYNFASVLMLANSALSLYLQPYVIRNYEIWSKSGQATCWFVFYSILSVLLYLLLLTVITLDSYYGYFLDSYSKDYLKVFTLIFVGIYFLGVYSFYVPWLFYGRYSKNISFTTIGVAVFNLSITVILVKYFGIVGAAVSTFLSYLLYFLVIRLQVLKYYKGLSFYPMYSVLSSLLFILFIYLLMNSIL